ncbi:MAG: hypothetical protein LUG62_09440 [Clostridiales bacterium]|nr:hypothetical protein [Clostridiales bacterium]
MSKVLKFIVHFVVIITLICVLGMVLPPFFGVKTVIMDDSAGDSNLPVGSVTYAYPVASDEVTLGSSILVTDTTEDGDTVMYSYVLLTMDAGNGTGTVAETESSESDALYVNIGDYVPQVFVTIPYIGYLLVATESIEGLIILGLAVLFLIILYVIAELWKRDPEDGRENDYDDRYVRTGRERETRGAERSRGRRMDGEDMEYAQPQRSRGKGTKPPKKTVRTGGFVDDIEEDEDEFDEEPSRPAAMQSAASEAHELLKREIAAATAEAEEEESAPAPVRKKRPASAASAKTGGSAKRAQTGTKTGSSVKKTQSTAKTETQGKPKKTVKKKVRKPVESAENADTGEETGAKKLAIPNRSAAQLADRARKAGDDPEVVKDDITDVTLFDYSDIIGLDDVDTDEE